MDHEEGCECCICSGQSLKSLEDWSKKMMKEYGWYCHLVGDEPSSTGFNAHTHGLPKTFKHKDLQIVIPLDGKITNQIFACVVNLIKAGSSFLDGMTADEVLKGYKVKFIDATECERDVLRIILPDADGNLDQGTFTQEKFNLQYEDL